MKQEDKELLLKDLSARLPYGVLCKVEFVGSVTDSIIPLRTDLLDEFIDYKCEVKPYLRPISSMTGSEKAELGLMGFRYERGSIINEDATEYDDYGTHPYTWVDETKCFEIMSFLNSHHFDCMGLIPKGLALEAPEDMYK